ncbi:hypothetical protein [Marinomonas mediterranea]|uniref:hypothetical protein n=1 Tax=Marinomonas mediterranea TaxID=119864 RepID=UPI002349D7E3|nr:hypothetical protein [Marinomonas mediterranea]WCN09970.1 hypothetical protein GV055_14100 [Marinomonas mediterranea]
MAETVRKTIIKTYERLIQELEKKKRSYKKKVKTERKSMQAFETALPIRLFQQVSDKDHFLVEVTEIEEHQLFQILAHWEEMLKDTSLSNDAHKVKAKTKRKMEW